MIRRDRQLVLGKASEIAKRRENIWRFRPDWRGGRDGSICRLVPHHTWWGRRERVARGLSVDVLGMMTVDLMSDVETDTLLSSAGGGVIIRRLEGSDEGRRGGPELREASVVAE